jgi:CRISPR-associated protein Cas2
MVVLVVQKVNESLRGEIARYMVEMKAGVFIGNLNARVTELLWKMICEKIGDGNAILAKSNNSEQGYFLKTVGLKDRKLTDFDGITLITKIKP